MGKERVSQSTKEHFIFQGSILAVAGIIVRIIGMIYRIPMANIIGTDGMAFYSYAFNIYNIILILSSFGMPMAISKMLSERLATKHYKNAAKIFQRSLIVAFVSGGAASLILFFGAGLFESFYGPAYVGLAIPLRVLAPTVLIVAILGAFRGFFEAHGSMTQTAISQIVEQIINAVVSIIASVAFMAVYVESDARAAFGAAGGTLGTCLGAAGGLAFILFIFFKNLQHYRENEKSDTFGVTISPAETYKYIILTLVPILVGQTMYNVSSLIDDLLYSNMAKMFLTDEMIRANAGNYGTTFSTLTSIPMGIAGAMASSLLPSIVSSFIRGEDRQVHRKIKHTVRVTMMIALPCAVGLAVLGQPFIQLLYGRFDSVQGDMMLKIGSFSVVFYTLATVTSTALQGINKIRVPVRHYIIALAVHVPVVIILILCTGASIYSLIIGVMVFAAVVFILNYISLYKFIGYRQEITKTFLVPDSCSCVMGVVTILAYEGFYALFGHHNLPALIVSVIVALLVYFVTISYAKNKKWY